MFVFWLILGSLFISIGIFLFFNNEGNEKAFIITMAVMGLIITSISLYWYRYHELGVPVNKDKIISQVKIKGKSISYTIIGTNGYDYSLYPRGFYEKSENDYVEDPIRHDTLWWNAIDLETLGKIKASDCFA